ncbi:MAG: hypothetical protein IJ549_05865 [Prevotella sp.]|nr:hypothetical protein [Prevotella sp.]
MKYDKLFVGGDLSGIQDYLYNISSRKAAVSLKGRSAKLNEEMQEAYNKITNAIAETHGTCEKLYCSGGKFYLTTQNSPTIVAAINRCKEEIIDSFWEMHMGQLGINISYVTYGESANGEFFVEGHDSDPEKNSGVLWKYVNADFARQKQQKFKKLLQENYKAYFEPIRMGESWHVCAVTGIESDACVLLNDEEEYDERENFYVLPIVKDQIEKGKALSIDAQGRIKDFEDYATTDGGEKGDTYLGILRMDVDGLGNRFIKGFDNLDLYKTFSNGVTEFFEKTIEHTLLEEHSRQPITRAVDKPYSHYLKVIYAGGDDLFIVGRWDKLIDFAALIHARTIETFNQPAYCWVDNEGITRRISISGGIAIVKPKFPIAKAADLAGEAEEAAKHFSEEKNAFHMLGKTISWNRNPNLIYPVDLEERQQNEFEYVNYFKDRFIALDEKGMSRSILHKLMLYSALADRNATSKKKDFRYVWHMCYFLKRFREPYKEKRKEIHDFCEQLSSRHNIDSNARSLELIGLAARWAELILRDNNKY